MRAIVQDRYGDADVLRLEEIERPEPGEGKVLVRVRAAGVDPSVWHLMTGLPMMVRGFSGVRRPRQRVRGSDVAGVVEAVGKGVTRLRPGDEVFGVVSGSFADYAVGAEKGLAAKPGTLSFAEAAAVPISGTTALQAVRDAGGIQPGQRVLILGASGGVGSFAVQLAKAFGAHVTGVASGAKLDLVRSLGADDVLDYTRTDPTDGSRRFDLVIDTGGNRPLKQLRRALTPAGTLVLVGGEGGGKVLGGFDRAVIRAPFVSLFTKQKLRGLVAATKLQDLETLRELIDAGRVRPAVERTVPLGQAAEAVRALHAGAVRGKLVVVLDD